MIAAPTNIGKLTKMMLTNIGSAKAQDKFAHRVDVQVPLDWQQLYQRIQLCLKGSTDVSPIIEKLWGV
jgi:hypothetical protein